MKSKIAAFIFMILSGLFFLYAFQQKTKADVLRGKLIQAQEKLVECKGSRSNLPR